MAGGTACPTTANQAVKGRWDRRFRLSSYYFRSLLRMAVPWGREADARVFLTISRDAQPANLSVAATRARLFGGSKALWPLSGVITRSASGHARYSAQALSMGQTTS
jgi:hypothetical protein